MWPRRRRFREAARLLHPSYVSLNWKGILAPSTWFVKCENELRLYACGHRATAMKTDWKECALVECVPGKQGGVPLVKGTRIPADQIIEELQLGSSISEIEENYRP